MVIKVASAALKGIDAYIIEVETDISFGMPKTTIVGLPDTAVQESRERVKTAIKNSGFYFPVRHIVVNLAPADTKKEGPSFDLPIALSVLAASDQLEVKDLNDFLVIGELSLDGEVRPVIGTLCYAIAARENGFKSIIVPEENARGTSVVHGLKVYPVKTLCDAVDIIVNKHEHQPIERSLDLFETDNIEYLLDFDDVKGQESARRAIEVAAAGNHNIMLVGPPGSGKTMLARRLPSILPPLTFNESLEATKLYSVCGLVNSKGD